MSFRFLEPKKGSPAFNQRRDEVGKTSFLSKFNRIRAEGNRRFDANLFNATEFDSGIFGIGRPSFGKSSSFIGTAPRGRAISAAGNGGTMPHKRKKTRAKSTGTRRRKTTSRRRTNMPTSLARSGLTRGQVAGIARPVFSRTAVFPVTMDTQLITVGLEAPVLVEGSSLSIHQWNMNSAFKPVNSSNQQAKYYDQLRAIYNNVIVMGARITVYFLQWVPNVPDPNNSVQFNIELIRKDAPNQIPSDDKCMNDPMNNLLVMNEQAASANRMTVSRYMNISRFYAEDIMNAQNLYSETGDVFLATQKNVLMFKIWMKKLGGGTIADGGRLMYRWQLTQYVRFTDRVKLSDT